MQSKENYLYNTFQGRIPSFPVLYISWTPPNQIHQVQDRMPAGKAISILCERCKKTQQWVLRPQAQEYAVVAPKKYIDLHGWSDCIDSFMRVVKQTNKMHIVPVRVMVGPAHGVPENAAWGGIDCAWLVIKHVDLETSRTVH